jgi:CHC2-type zinc finger protein/Toprim domain-containing protein
VIPDAVLDDLRARVPVSKVVSKYVKLTRAGPEWKASSPFRKERTPSFFANDQKGFFYDFGSGEHGDIFDFVMKIEGLNFREAVKRCAEMAAAVTMTASPARSTSQGEEQAVQLRKARWLWSQREPIIGSIAETYLRGRGYHGSIPETLALLPTSGDNPPALIAAYGIATEPEPGVIAIAENAVLGVHLIKLKPDGSDRLRDDPKCKFTIGRGFIAPIMLAPPNDLLGMVVAEGLEDALNAHEASGLGAWAAGTATRLPALADLIPSYIECVTIMVDDDDAGRTNSRKLMARLRDRNIGVRLTSHGSFP